MRKTQALKYDWTSLPMNYVLHCTKKLLERIKPVVVPQPNASDTQLGNWYATALFWKPQVALLVNEGTLLPVLMPLAPASSLAQRFPYYLAQVLAAHGVPESFIAHEVSRMASAQYGKTANRSVVGVMNQFAYIAEHERTYVGSADLIGLSLKLSETPCSPLYEGAGSPQRELRRLVTL